MSTQDKVIQTALNLLSRRAHTIHELKTKLKKKKFDYSVIDTAISECIRLNLLNDEEFANIYLDELKYKGYGRFYIKNALQRKGILASYAERIIEEHISDEEEISLINNHIKRKLKSLKKEVDLRKKKEKLYRFLLSKGFSSHLVGDVLSNCNLKEDE